MVWVGDDGASCLAAVSVHFSLADLPGEAGEAGEAHVKNKGSRRAAYVWPLQVDVRGTSTFNA